MVLAETILGIIVLLFGAELFVRGAVALAKLLKWSPLVIGVTVVAIGTSLPELTVSLFSAMKGDYGLSIGNIVGSNIVNVFLVLGLAVLMGNIRIGTTKTPKNAWVMLLASIFYWYWHNFKMSNALYWAYAALLGVVVFSTMEIWWAWWGKNHEDEHLGHKVISRDKKWVMVIPIAIYLLSVGGNLVVINLEKLAVYWGVTTTFLGLLISATATSLPELATTIVGLAKDEEKLVMGNIIGSNIYNLLLVGGIVGLFGKDVQLSPAVWIMYLISTLVLFAIVQIYKGRHIPKRAFWWLMAGLGGYLVSIF